METNFEYNLSSLDLPPGEHSIHVIARALGVPDSESSNSIKYIVTEGLGMNIKNIQTRIKNRIIDVPGIDASATEKTSYNDFISTFIPLDGELIIFRGQNTLSGDNTIDGVYFKVGDGESYLKDLPYAYASELIELATAIAQLTSRVDNINIPEYSAGDAIDIDSNYKISNIGVRSIIQDPNNAHSLIINTGGSSETITIQDNDNKVTNVGNHYLPTGTESFDIDASSTQDGKWGNAVVTGVKLSKDAAGHITALELDSIKIPTPKNQCIKSDNITFDENAVINIEAGNNITIETDNTNNKLTINSSYINSYHTKVSQNGFTYNVTSDNGAPTLTFAIPTGSGDAEVALGSHNHDSAYLKISDAQSTYIPLEQKGVKLGVATLDQNGLIPSSQLPSYVDDILEGYLSEAGYFYYMAADKEVQYTGETGKIYVDLTTHLCYRYSGSSYVEISPSIALSNELPKTDSFAYPSGSIGTASTAARADHIHPVDQTRLAYAAIADNQDEFEILSNNTIHLKAIFGGTI